MYKWLQNLYVAASYSVMIYAMVYKICDMTVYGQVLFQKHIITDMGMFNQINAVQIG